MINKANKYLIFSSTISLFCVESFILFHLFCFLIVSFFKLFFLSFSYTFSINTRIIVRVNSLHLIECLCTNNNLQPAWLQRLTNRWICRVEAMMTDIAVERFELVDDSPENEGSCRICLVRYFYVFNII